MADKKALWRTLGQGGQGDARARDRGVEPRRSRRRAPYALGAEEQGPDRVDPDRIHGARPGQEASAASHGAVVGLRPDTQARQPDDQSSRGPGARGVCCSSTPSTLWTRSRQRDRGRLRRDAVSQPDYGERSQPDRRSPDRSSAVDVGRDRLGRGLTPKAEIEGQIGDQPRPPGTDRSQAMRKSTANLNRTNRSASSQPEPRKVGVSRLAGDPPAGGPQFAASHARHGARNTKEGNRGGRQRGGSNVRTSRGSVPPAEFDIATASGYREGGLLDFFGWTGLVQKSGLLLLRERARPGPTSKRPTTTKRSSGRDQQIRRRGPRCRRRRSGPRGAAEPIRRDQGRW